MTKALAKLQNPNGALLPTDPRPGETNEECTLWFGWCKGVVELDEALAAKFAWTQRRNQLEGMGALKADPAQRLTQGVFNELDTFAIVAREHLLQTLENPSSMARRIQPKDALEAFLKAAGTPTPEVSNPIAEILENEAPPEIKLKALEVMTWIASRKET